MLYSKHCSGVALQLQRVSVRVIEYCASHAMPSVEESQYLKHIGEHLHANVDVMWTGKISIGMCEWEGLQGMQACICTAVCFQFEIQTSAAVILSWVGREI